MRPLHLRIDAVGPYRGRTDVDFGPLLEAGLFLVHGATGSGKSFLLDAMTFALFGSIGGDERDFRELRSNMAPIDEPTRVELTFQVGPRQFRVERMPAQDRPKARGVGVRRASPEAALYELREGADPELLASGATTTNDAITSLLGLDVDRFRQVSVLPQGRFREMLTARANERQAILESLFATSSYRRLERAAFEVARTKETALRIERSSIDAILQTAALSDRAAIGARLAHLAEEEAAHEASLVELRATRDAAESRARLANHRRDVEVEANQAARALERASSDAEAAEARFAAAATLSERLPDIEKELHDLRAEIVRLRMLEGPIRAAAIARAAIERSTAALVAAQDEQARAIAKRYAAREALRAVARAENASAAARLARELTPGEPCVVCGSTEHPAPHALVEHESADASATSRKTLERAVESADSGVRSAEAKVRELAERAAAAKAELATLEEHVGASGSDADLANGIRSLSARSAALDDEAGRIRKALREAEHERTASRARLDAARARVADAQAKLERTPGQEDGGAAMARAREATETLEHAVAARERVRSELARLRQTHERLAGSSAQIASLEAAHRTAAHVAEVARGANAYGVSFHRFVLGTLFDDVLSLASAKLRVLSGGRYELYRRVLREDLRRTAGLEIDVFDHHAGEARPVATLSGGESFLAALALALGMRETMQSRESAAPVEALFIDEGFGNLDDEALDYAIDLLSQLRDAGHIIGVVSHVGELRERLRAQLHVERRRTGSAVTLRGV